MSYTFLQEQGEASSAGCFSDIEPFVRSRLNLTAEKSSCNDSETGYCLGSRSGTMCEPSTESRGEELQTLCVAGFRVQTSVLLEKAQALKEKTLDSGRKWQGSFAKYDHNTSSWKTAQCLLFGGLEGFSETWPRWGLMQDGECFRLEMLEHDTSVRGSGYWPTPLTDSSTSISFGTETAYAKARRLFGLNLIPKAWEHLMGWPVGWTNADGPLETDSFQKWLNWHGRF